MSLPGEERLLPFLWGKDMTFREPTRYGMVLSTYRKNGRAKKEGRGKEAEE
jgi:hypothetical protein